MKFGDRNGISEVTRRAIVDWLLLQDKPFHGRLDLIDFLRRVWNLSSMPSTDSRFKDAEGDIWQHMVRNNDWTESDLLNNRLDVLRCPDEQFCKFVETTVHPLARSDRVETQVIVKKINELLAPDGYRLVEGSIISGRPIYKAVTDDAAPTPGTKWCCRSRGNRDSTSSKSQQGSNPQASPSFTTRMKNPLCGARS
jgi:hypothetical protein